MQQDDIAVYEDKDAYDVYVAALQLGRPHQDSIERAEVLIIQQEIESWEGRKDPGIKFAEDAKAEWEPVLESLVLANQKPMKLKNIFPLKTPYKLLSKEDMRKGLPEGGGWKAYYKKFPNSNGYIWFSAVGFNAEKTKAIVYVSHLCGSLCGGGGPHFLERKDGKWVAADVQVSFGVWAS